MPILHFSGNFKYQIPRFNNSPERDARKPDAKFNDKPVKFDEDVSKEEVHQMLQCDPLKYFEFEFSEVYVRKITYDDGTSTDMDKKQDSVVGERVMLKGILVDVSPHLNRGQLFAGDFRVLDVMLGKLSKAVQSEIHLNIRSELQLPPGLLPWFTYSGHFETPLSEVYPLEDPSISKENSQYLKEIGEIKNLKIYFHVSRYDISRNEGDLYGYIGPSVPESNNNKIRVRNRRLIDDPKIKDPSPMINDFRLQKDGLEGTYEILETRRQGVLRYLDFIPFIDDKYQTPKGYRYFVYFFKGKDEVKINDKLEINASHKEMKLSGGIYVFKLPKEVENPDELNIVIKVTKEDGDFQTLMIEPDWDVVSDEDQHCITIGSGRQIEVKSRVYHYNQLLKESVEVHLESETENKESPHVAWFTNYTISDGQIIATIQTRNLEDSEEIDDPVTKDDPEFKGRLKGNLPWDRYYGNTVTIKIGNPSDPNAEMVIQVRVIHVVNPDNIPENQISFKRDILPLFSYYLRYYPWLHVTVHSCRYEQFLDLNNYNLIKSMIRNIFARLSKDDSDWEKMPRSRDFPFNGLKLFERLKTEPLLE